MAGSIFEIIGYALIGLLFFGAPLALVAYGIAVALRSGTSPGSTQELEKVLPPGQTAESEIAANSITESAPSEHRPEHRSEKDMNHAA